MSALAERTHARTEPDQAREVPTPYAGLRVPPETTTELRVIRIMADNAAQARFKRGDTDPARMEGAARALRLDAFDKESDVAGNTIKSVKPKEFHRRLNQAAEGEEHILYAAEAMAKEALGTIKVGERGRPITRVQLQEVVDAEDISLILRHDNPVVEQELSEVLAAAGATNSRDVTLKEEKDKGLTRVVMDSNVPDVVLVLERQSPQDDNDLGVKGKGLVTVYARNRGTYADLNKEELGI